MKRKISKVRVRRITVDEKLSPDLYRFVICFLREGLEKFTDLDDEWQKERPKLVNPQNYSQALYAKKSEAPAWETLKEGQVFLSGEFEVVGDPAKPERFKINPGQRKFMQVDKLALIDDGVRALYSDVLGRG
jgi:hypothetical protein